VTNWRLKINIWKKVPKYDEDNELKSVPKITKVVASNLRKLNIKELKTFPSRFLRCQTESQFDRVLNSMYDVCDRELIWVEPRKD